MDIMNLIGSDDSNNSIICTNPSLENPGEYKQEINTTLSSIDQVSIENKRYCIAKIRQWLEVDHTLSEIYRQHGYSIASVYSLIMEQDFWITYQSHTHVEVLWLSNMSKAMLEYHSISRVFFKIENFMNQQLKIIEKQLHEAFIILAEYLQKEEEEKDQIFKSSTIDTSLLIATTIALVRHDQSPLHKKYEELTFQLILNVNDIRLVREFYGLNPDEVQIIYAASIWKTMIYEEYMKKELTNAQRHLFDDNKYKLYSILQNLMVNITHIIPTIREFKARSLHEIISLAEAKLEEYAQTIEEQKKYFLLYSQHYCSSTPVGQMLNTIERRRITIKQRTECTNDFSTMFTIPNNEKDLENLIDDDIYEYLDYYP
ncbi:unnamed protein product [Adineta steineri]|uniref:Uncharacterized protein n=1 Tax=Adineta steineri TaxID=433720 RepID=A0A820BR74_9BILA|nr:unnamed protein product [Adineta steineri]CAF4204345.1 unnamed protein product [Adineta steineri]